MPCYRGAHAARWRSHAETAMARAFFHGVGSVPAISRNIRALMVTNRSIARGSAPVHPSQRAAHCSASCGVWPEAMSRTAKQAGSMNRAPLVGQAQSMIHAPSSAIRMLSGLKSVCRSRSPSSSSAWVGLQAHGVFKRHCSHACRRCYLNRYPPWL